MDDVARPRVAVVGHLEWIRFARVDRIPGPGEIAHATASWEEPGGGGAVAAVQMARLAGECTFFTAVGDDEVGRRAIRELEQRGLRVEAAVVPDTPTRAALTQIDPDGERTITTLGERLEPRAADQLPWNGLDRADAAFFTAGDVGALEAARRARVLVATSRARRVLVDGAVRLDALCGSANDPAEGSDDLHLEPRPALLVTTDGRRGGRWRSSDGAVGRYDAQAPPGPVVDTYGAGDSFMGAFTYALGSGMTTEQALVLAARCGAAVTAGRGPYERQLGREDL